MARGPAYPFISLEQAVNLARELYEYTKRTPANLNAVLKEKWDYSPTSSSATKIIAAMKYFGLIELGQANDKSDTVRITDRAYRILVDTIESPERKRALKDAFLSPKAYKMCWDQWGEDMPPSARSTLIFNEGFIDSTVDAFLTNYRKSMQFAGLDRGEVEEKQPDGGALGVNGDQKGGADIAKPIQSVGAPPPAAPPAPTPAPTAAPAFVPGLAKKGAGMRQEVFALAEGDVTIQWPERLSAESLEDFTDWLRILERKIKRASQPQQQRPVDGGDSGVDDLA